MKSKTNIGFYLASPSWGGLEMNFVRLARWFLEEGKMVTFWCLKGSPTSAEIRDSGARLIETNSPKKYLDIRSGKRIARELDNAVIEILFFSFGKDLDPLAWAKTFSSVNPDLIYVQQMQLGLSKKNFYQSWKYSKISNWVAPLAWLKEETIKFTRVGESKIVEIPLGQDLRKFSEFDRSQNDCRVELGLPVGKTILGVLGRFDPAKGQEFLIGALSSMLNANKHLVLALMGENTRSERGDHKRELQELVKKKNLEGSVIFLPFSPDPRSFYNAIDVFIMSSKSETFGMVTIEAMACGLPVLGTDSGGSPELLDFGKAGFTFQPDNSEDLVQKLNSLLEEPDQMTKLGMEARSRAMKLYSKERILKQYFDLLDRL